MKKSLILLFGALLLLTACNSSNSTLTIAKEESFKPGVFLDEDLALYDLTDNIGISLGMSKSNVEKKLGSPLGPVDFLGRTNYKGTDIFYKDDKVTGFMISDNTDSFDRFTTPRRIKFGDSLDQVIVKYGEPLVKEERSNGNSTVIYIVEKVDNKYKLLQSFDEASKQENTYSLSMNVYNDSGVSLIMIADYWVSRGIQ